MSQMYPVQGSWNISRHLYLVLVPENRSEKKLGIA